MSHRPVNDALRSLFEGLNTGVTAGIAHRDAGAERAANRAFLDEQRRQLSRSQFAGAEAGGREGTSAQVMDVFNFLSQPPADQSRAGDDLSMLLADNPGISMTGIPAGQPPITPNAASGMTSDPIREALMARSLPTAKKQFAPQRPPAAPRASTGGRTFNFSLEANRALDTVRENQGTAGRLRPARPEDIQAAAGLLTRAKGEPLTPQEFAALKALGRQVRSTTPRG